MSKDATYHQHLCSSLKMPHDIHYPVLFAILVIYGIFVYNLFILYPFYHYIKTTSLSRIFCLLPLIETPRWKYSELSAFKFISFISCLRTSSFTESFALWVIEKYNFICGPACFTYKIPSSLSFMLFWWQSTEVLVKLVSKSEVNLQLPPSAVTIPWEPTNIIIC